MSPTKESAMWLEVLRTLRDELRKLAYFGVRALPLLVLLVIPGINLIAAPLWLAFSAWMLALEYTEVPLANHGMSFVNIRQRVAAHRATSLGFGVAVLALTLVPGLQLLTIPAAVAGATAMVVREGMAQS
jgi:CysZ protein